MATFTAYAKVLTPDDPLMKAFAAGITDKLPGQTLQEFLEQSGGVYEIALVFPPRFRRDIRAVGS